MTMKQKRRMPPLNLILLGDPASGKATQSKRLVKEHRFYDLDMGREVNRPAAKRRYNYAATTGIGHLTPTGVVRDIFKKVIFTTPARRGILFNGTPKMIGEAKLVASWLRQAKRADPLVIYLSIPTSEVMRRAAKRRIYVRGKLVRRDDDSVRALRNRKRYYQKQISQVVTFFKDRYVFRRISGVGTETEVAKRIADAVTRFEHTRKGSHGA